MQSRFLSAFEATLIGLESIIESFDFVLIKSFLEEFLLYLRTLFDISVEHSAKIINQFLKILFNKNALNFNVPLLKVNSPVDFANLSNSLSFL